MSEPNGQTSRESRSEDRSRPMYYGGSSRQMYYGGGVRPIYYGGSSAYGAPYGGYSGGGGQEEESMMGAVTIGRVLRVCLQRWITIVVFIILGALASFALFKVSPTIFEAVSTFEMSVRRPRIITNMQDVVESQEGGSLEEVFNTRVARLKSREFFEKAIAEYRTLHPSSEVTTEELVEILRTSNLTLQRRSKLASIAARSTDPQLAADLANIYLRVAVAFTTDQNKSKSESAVAWLYTLADQERRKLERADKEVFDFRMANQIDSMMSRRLLTEQAFQKKSQDILILQEQITTAALLNKTLEGIKDNPEYFGTLPASVPRSGEIDKAFQKLQDTSAERNSLLIRLTAQHPDVRVKEKEVEMYKQQFADAVFRALETSKANLDVLQQQLSILEPVREDLLKTFSDFEQKITMAQTKIDSLIFERNDVENGYQALIKRLREAQYAADENTATIEPIEFALPPEKPVLPNPFIIFAAGPFLGIMLGVLFVLMVDHFEDKIVGISDVEQRLRLKTLAVLPHVRRKNRKQIAQLVATDKFSQLAEAVASLRNLLDSPRYAEMSKVLLCISTQPGEGKTITSCNLAISYALSGEKTLLIDFDMRRPRLARIFDESSNSFTSLPHTLTKADTSLFPTLPIHSTIENLDLVCSKASSEISPASLMGSGVIVEFFKWARENYDRIIVDSPPFGVVGDVMSLSSLVDAVMILYCPHRTRFNPLKHAARHLTEAGARVIGAIVNDIDFDRHRLFDKDNYHYKYAYQYGKGYGDAVSKASAKRSVTPALAVGSAHAQELVDDEVAVSDADVDVKDMFDASMVDDDE